MPELAFEAGPLATIPAAVPGEVLVNLCSVMRQDESSRIRFAAAYALGVLGSPAMGPMNASAQPIVIADVVSGLTHQDAATRQVIARVAGRVFAPNEGASAPAAVGDALITAMNDKDALVRRWAMDSLGWLKFEHAVQALTDRASYYGKNEEGAGALHAVARIASSGSAPVLRALLANTYIPFRLLSIEGLGRIGDQGSLPAINESATGVNDAGVALAASYARFMLGQADVVAIADALEHPDIAVQAKVYLAEIAVLKPDAIHALLRTPNPSTRMLAVEVLGASRHVDEIATLEPLLKDPAPEVVEVDVRSDPPPARLRDRRQAVRRSRLRRGFYARPTLEVAADLIGKVLDPRRARRPRGGPHRGGGGLHRRGRPGLPCGAGPHEPQRAALWAGQASRTST